MSKSAAIQAITIILSGYPNADSADRAAFMQLASKSLADYPDDLLDFLASPERGIVRKSKFIPTIAECCAFMDAQFTRQGQEAEFKRREAQRKLPPAEGPTEAPETRIAVLGKFGELSRSLRSDPAYQAAVDYAADSIKTQAEIMDAELNFRASIKRAANPPPLPLLSAEAVKKFRSQI